MAQHKQNFVCSFFSKDRGVALTEFAILFPVLLTLMIGLIEISNFVFVHNKADRTTGTLSTIITRDDLSEDGIDNLLAAAPHLMMPYGFSANGNGVFVTALDLDPDTDQPRILWTRTYGTPGAGITEAEFSERITLDPLRNETFIVVQVFYQFQPMMAGTLFGEQGVTIKKTSIAVPRSGRMKALL